MHSKGKQDQNTKPKEYQTKLTDILFPRQHQMAAKSDDKQPTIEAPLKKQSPPEPQLTSRNSSSEGSNLSARTEPIPEVFHNVEFYRNKIPSIPNGATIERILKDWSSNYELLEKHHGFIQWLFPNLFQSRFNSQAYAILPGEIDVFLTDPEVYNRYVRAYQMMLGFYGMKLKSKETGEIAPSRHPPFQERCSQTLLRHFHNHMRITRILSSLTLLGFAKYAKQLLKFLKDQIFSEKGYMRQLQRHRVYEKEWQGFQKVDPADSAVSKYFDQYSTKSKQEQTKELPRSQLQKPTEIEKPRL